MGSVNDLCSQCCRPLSYHQLWRKKQRGYAFCSRKCYGASDKSKGNINTEDSFWKKVNVGTNVECWNWMGSTNNKGYGMFSIGGVRILAHRFALSTKTNVPERKCVMHTCDNPLCCNPRHLMIGTHAENMRDRDQKRRTAHGELSGSAKLTESRVRLIRQMSSSRLCDVAKIFGVNRTTIAHIRAGRTWRHVK